MNLTSYKVLNYVIMTEIEHFNLLYNSISNDMIALICNTMKLKTQLNIIYTSS